MPLRPQSEAPVAHAREVIRGRALGACSRSKQAKSTRDRQRPRGRRGPVRPVHCGDKGIPRFSGGERATCGGRPGARATADGAEAEFQGPRRAIECLSGCGAQGAGGLAPHSHSLDRSAEPFRVESGRSVRPQFRGVGHVSGGVFRRNTPLPPGAHAGVWEGPAPGGSPESGFSRSCAPAEQQPLYAPLHPMRGRVHLPSPPPPVCRGCERPVTRGCSVAEYPQLHGPALHSLTGRRSEATPHAAASASACALAGGMCAGLWPEFCLTTQHLLRGRGGGGGSDTTHPPPLGPTHPPTHPALSDWANFSPGPQPMTIFLWRLRHKSV